MDVSNFFNRLRQPAKPQASRRDARQLASQDDVGEFERAWVAIKETLEQPDERQIIRGIKSTDVPADLQHLVDALVYESNRLDEDETGPCFEFFLRHDLLSQLERLCFDDRPHGVKAEVLRAINNLVVLLSDRFLMHNAVHRPLRRLLRSCVGDEEPDVAAGTRRLFGAAGLAQARTNEQGQAGFDAELVDLMCILCAKVRAHPSLLLIFFHDKGWLSDSSRPSSFMREQSDALSLTPHRPFSPSPSTRTGLSDPSRSQYAHSRPGQRFEFLLFSYMLRFVHREGRTGDFARAGLLFLFDIAFVTQNEDLGEEVGSTRVLVDGEDPLQMARNALAEYILDGDFADVMAAAVGAVYSLLPRKVRVPGLVERERQGDGEEEELPSTQDIEVHDQLDLLLKLFGLMQDIVNRCTSLHLPAFIVEEEDDSLMQALGYAIADSILDAMQRSLLDNVLYPSILECSPTDGSSVAVMTYLDVLLRNMDDGPLLSRFLDYLLDLENRDAPAPEEMQQSRIGGSDRFTIRDIVLDNLRSDVPEARAAALRLARTVMVEHCAYSAKGLLTAVGTPPKPIYPDMSAYVAVLERIDPTQSTFDQSPAFSTYLADVHVQLSSDRCLQITQLQSAFLDETETEAIRKVERMTCAGYHYISPTDAFVQAVYDRLRKFLANELEENIALTGVILGMGMCGSRSLKRVLVGSGAGEDVWADLDAEAEGGLSGGASDNRPASRGPREPGSGSIPAVLSILQSITDQIAVIRGNIADFDALLIERRRALMGETIDDALKRALAHDLSDSTPVSAVATPKKSGRPAPATPLPKKARASLAGSIKDFFSPKKKALPPEAESSVARNASNVDDGREQAVEVPEDGDTVVNRPRSAIPDAADTRRITIPASAPTGINPTTERRQVDLDLALDNTIILEEFIKEIMALLAARDTFGLG